MERLKKSHALKAPEAPKAPVIELTLPNSYSVKGSKLKTTKLTIPTALKKFQKRTDSMDERPSTTNTLYNNHNPKNHNNNNNNNNNNSSGNDNEDDSNDNNNNQTEDDHRQAGRQSSKFNEEQTENGSEATIPPSFKHKNLTVIMSREFSQEEKELILSENEVDIGNKWFFPLEIFDDEEGESHTPEEWIALGKNSGGTKATSKFFDGKDYSWQPCRVLDYSVEDSTYLIQWESNQQKKYVKRLNLCFDDEDRELLQQRIRMALIRRINYERRERYMLQVDKIDNEDVSLMSEEQVDRILSLVATEFPVKHLHVIENGVIDMKENYLQGVKLSIFEHYMQNPVEREKCAHLDLPPQKKRQPAPACGVIRIPDYDFVGTRDYIDKHIFYSHKELIDTLRTVHEQIMIFKDDRMIDTVMEDLAQPCKLEDWCNLQNKTITKIANKFKDEWSTKATTVVQNGLNGSNNFYEDDIEKFKSKRLYRVLRLINLIMSFQLRDMSRQALQQFARFMDQYKVQEGEVLSPLEVNGKTPLFILEIVVSNRQCQFRPSLEAVYDSIKYAFDNVLDDTDNIPGVGPKLFPLLTLDERDYILPNLKKDDPISLGAWATCDKIIVDNMTGPNQLLSMFKEFEPFLSYDIDEYTTNFLTEHPQLDAIREELKRLYDASEKIQHKSLDEVKFNLFLVQCNHIKDVCLQRTLGTANSLLSKLADMGAASCDKIRSDFEVIYEKIQVIPQNAEELAELKDYLMKVSLEIEALQSKFSEVQENFNLLNDFSFNTSEEHFRIWIETHGWPKKVYAVLQDSNIRLEEDKRKFMDDLTESLSTLLTDIDKYSREIVDFASFNDIDFVEEYYQRTQDMHNKIAEAKSKAQLFNNRERMFNWKQTEFTKLTELAEAFEPTESLWTIAYQESQRYPEWMDGQFKMLNPTEVETNAFTWFDTLKRLEKKLTDPGPKSMATTLRKKLAEFKKHIPLITALRNDGLRGRHWQKISALVGKPIDTNTLTFRDLLDMNLDHYIAQIQEISAFASQELKITRGLQEMEDEWKSVVFQLGKYGTTWKLIELDDLQAMLDDHIVLTQSMRSSPYVKEIELDVISWERKLLDRQDILDQWILCQVAYLYLEPIFTSQDIVVQLPDEATKFGIVDKSWKAIMDITHKNKYVTEVMTIENLLQNFQSHNKMLDEIHKGLKDYLETKRKKFPRFYFLADDELLEILSETKDPLRVQPHLRKCFEGIDKLEFTEAKEIVAMFSKEQEKIDFTRSVVPHNYSGKVELWLLEVEKEMRASVRNVIEKSIVDYAATKRSKWILEWQGQVVLAVSQLFWTKEVEEALMNGGLKGIQRYLTKLEKQMKELIDIVRGRLTSLQRITLGALVVMDVHAKDVVANLVREAVNDISDFEWQSQLRYYWEGDTPQLIVRQVTAQIDYGYEYLGNTPRLVITPLTDRCYRTLMGALQLHKGGAPEGPAGTGKTETTKDLAKAIAKFCVVYNCSDTLDSEGMEKFFKGLASSGAWSCFDEFNRIQLEVLSVVAQQIQQIQLAVAAKQKRFFFEGFEINIDPSCAIFITMNPGYAGRSELPDNLKALFRPVAMMIPDYAMIAEISLFSYGFYEGRNLARKIVATYRLCSEQLSSQDHYDYGMRAVKSVLVRAGTLKQQCPDDREDELMLRSLMDVNLPKFLAEDIPLFEGIISDLFPTVNVPRPNYNDLISCLEESCNTRNLQPLDPFIKKCIQLYEMIIVRHGLMLVGYSYSGKTSSYRVLRDALQMLNQRGLEEKVQIQVINPKSITMGQLYGSTDIATKEWKDGILAIHFRRFSEGTDTDRKWLIFDGPVDAIWIESMNTVLDDNKKLCLPNGQIIKMSDTMNMIFEVQDLAVASPATVSRCGMVYMEPSDIGWRPMVQSWMNRKLPIGLQDKATVQQIWQILDCLVPKVLDFIDKNVKEYLATSRMTRTNGMLNLFESLIDEFADEEASNKMKPRDKSITVESLLLFSIVWSLGATGDESSRKQFDTMLRHETESNSSYKFLNTFPSAESVYDYTFDNSKRSWVDWLKTIPSFSIPKETLFQDIIVPTTDTTRYSFLLDTLITHQKPVLFVGPTGTGKSIYVKQRLLYGLDRDKYIPNFLNMSARTSANQTQDILESKFDRRKKGTIGAPIGKKIVVFVDDLNLPALEEYGAQPPIELLRQFMDHGGWYDRSDKQGGFTKIVDVQFVGAMGPPGGGRNPITARYSRHFNIIGLTPFDNSSLKVIFTEIINWFLGGTTMMTHGKQIVAASLEMYNSVANIFLPTPAKSHYTFNLRDLSKIFQGLCQANIKHIDEKNKLLRLWCHEAMRVFQDRLVNNEDRNQFDNLLKQILRTQFAVDIKDLIPNKVLVFSSFMDKDNDDSYVEVTNVDQLSSVINRALEEFNDNPVNQKMDLVLFKFAIDHIARISRIISQPYGNALLIGVGGSGRQSLTKLATFIADLRLFQITLTKKFGLVEWKDRMKSLLRQTGIDGASTVFLFSDTQIKDIGFLEDISNLLNTGEIPNLYTPDELKEIYEILRPIARRNNKDQSVAGLYNLFVERCRNNMHIVVCMSPIGDALRNYLRMFPSLVNCCTIDWFSEWPSEALHSVALNSFQSIKLLEGREEECVDVCVYFHNSVTELSQEFLYKTKRHNYVTPTTYLDMLQNFEKLAEIREEELTQEKLKYDTGLERIAQTEIQVAAMQKELETLQPELVLLSEQNEQLSLNIKQESEEAEEQRKIVEAEELIMKQQNEENEKVREYCVEQLKKALPALERAQDAIRNLKDQDIVEVRALQNPPEGVKTVMKVVCMLKGIPPAKKTDDMGKKEDDWWTPSKKMMSEKGFLSSIKNFDAESIKDENIQKLLPVINSVDFSEDKIKNASKAAQNIRAWLAAMVEFHESNKVVKPRKAALEQAEAEYAESMKKLEEKKAIIRGLEEKLKRLADQLAECVEKKNKLQNEYEDVSTKLDRAQQLIGLLSGEKERWSNTSRDLEEKRKHLVGDMLLSSGFISYLGAFTGQFRDEIVSKWKKKLDEFGILYTSNYSLAKISGDVLKIRQWNIQGLPADNFSIDNAIIVENTRRWPLFIDPQGQARNWIRKYEEERGSYLNIKMSDPNLVRSLEQAIELGTAAIIENVGEEIDPALEPLLLKQTKKVAGQVLMQLSDKPIIYKESFRLYLITNISNPHYLPEVSTKVTIVNFMITPTGLQDQLLQIVVMNEERKLEDEKNRLVKENAESLIQLKKIDNDILELLVSTPREEILGGTKVINTLSNSKQVAKKTSARQAEAIRMEARIDEKRNHFNPVAINGSVLFFCVMELPNVDPMYQFSLKWFRELFTMCIAETKHEGDRIHNLKDHFTYSLYQKICRALFERDKLLLSFLMCISLMQHNGAIDRNELRFLLTGGTIVDSSKHVNPAKEWISEKAWAEINNLTALKGFESFRESFVKDLALWKKIADNAQPHLEQFPGKWQTPMQKMLIIRIIRPDRLVPAISHFITTNLDERFIKPPTFNLRLSYNDSNCTKPLVFILSPGVDPMERLRKFADSEGRLLDTLSLGQNQGPKAVDMISRALIRGNWVVLQNCHLDVNWLPTLEKIVEEFDAGKTADSFRLWLTSMPSPKFPVSILQNSIKITDEPPKGLRANLLKSWTSDLIADPNFFTSTKRPRELKKLLFGLCFFHALVQERRQFGALGWNIPYEFNESDLRISIEQLRMFLSQQHIPFKALTYLTGECNYGGRVTDDHDRRTLMAILGDFFNKSILMDSYRFSSSGIYYAPKDGDYTSYIDYINTLPLEQQPEVFGLDSNASITKNQSEAMAIFHSFSLTQERGSSGGGDTDEVVYQQAAEILTKMPLPYNVDDVKKKYPISYHDSMNTVLIQELIRYNKLIEVIRETTRNVQKAIKGEVVMSQELESLSNSLLDNIIPDLWKKKSYPSCKSLGGYVADLIKRLEFFQQWIDNGPPTVFWISGFFFTQSFLTGVKQNYARQKRIEIDTIEFDFEIMKSVPTQPPSVGCYAHGLYLEGARWDSKRQVLGDSLPKKLYDELPVLWLKPQEAHLLDNSPHYPCPVYKTSERRGTLSTTGHSTNFVMTIKLPSDKEEKHWVKRGCALLCQLD